MQKISRTWSLMSACWQILKKDKEMLVFPLFSGICCLLLLASFALPLYFTSTWRPPEGDAGTARQVVYYGTLFLFYVCNYFVAIFFNCAIVACATIRMGGGDPTVNDGFRAAASRLPVIAGWALVSATVGLVLRIIEDRSEKIGRFIAGLLGMGWTVVSFLVIPILVVENKGPVTALKESTQMLKKTWGEQLVGNFSFGLLFFLLSLPAFAVIVLSLFSGKGVVMIAGIGLMVAYLIALGLVQSALQSIFQAAVYLYARNGQVPEGFREEFLSGAMMQK
jgi:hydrogenase-4 membrane subunit HyfE